MTQEHTHKDRAEATTPYPRAVNGLLQFLLAAFVAVIAGVVAISFNVVAFHGGFGPNDIPEGLLMIATFVAIFTLAGMVAIGLPVTVVLKLIDHEHAWLYALLGALAGFLATAVAIGPANLTRWDDFTLPAIGALCGLTAGAVWGRWRERGAKVAPAAKPANPVHDLLF
ncbi:hypothetical protein [Aurantiacibacter gangjinensis]|uniref:Uncharacterized protein n=1 Tax=Aurantiacibacter gangjinensis TaxID=502682 RepID=A0A0G9MM88_9SPHN|nr:hypothetical protein [Aurantiacibacter gangjinensis]APE27720.1 hypothetical protein BMF35_a0891 [Aurantiacibacter gangjinensis]KLE31724.1 hypothetical protein AAW01_09445 [Aurantiacibacter gangjinensis]